MKKILVLSLVVTLSGCGGVMNSEFSCNKTAGDACLTIEDVDAMTRFADEPDAQKEDKVWIAPTYK